MVTAANSSTDAAPAAAAVAVRLDGASPASAGEAPEQHGFAEWVLAVLNAVAPLPPATPPAAPPAGLGEQGVPAGGRLPAGGMQLPLLAAERAPLPGSSEGAIPALVTADAQPPPSAKVALEWLEAGEVAVDDLRLEAELRSDPALSPPRLRQAPATATAPAVPPSPGPSPSLPSFEQALGERLSWMMRHGAHDARIRVHPESLGAIDIRLAMDGDTAQVTMSSTHAAVREALEQAVPRLRESFGAAGIDLAQVDIDAGDARTPERFARGADVAQAVDEGAVRSSAEGQPANAAAAGYVRLGLIDTFA